MNGERMLVQRYLPGEERRTCWIDNRPRPTGTDNQRENDEQQPLHLFFSTRTLLSSIRFTGVSPFVGAASIASTACIPSVTRPNAVYLPSSAGLSAVQM